MRHYRIVVGIDLTEYAEIVLEHALDQAARHRAPEVHCIFVREKQHRKRPIEELAQRLTRMVYPALKPFNEHGSSWRVRLHVRTGKPDEQIAILAQDLNADLIVIGQFGLHNPSDSFKTVPGRVLRAAPCATLVVGMPPAQQSSQICNACAAVREDTEGERWFCAEHTAAERIEHVVSPTTVWSGGSLMW
ncbi:MAG TPA: universal stress protein [Kofleriaceae bacterium]|nr:universal stress protein [Kofleriaceae bacterium]